MKKTILFAVLFLFGMTAFAQQPQRTVTDTIHSSVLNAPRAYNVILPPSFHSNPDKTYPVLYLLHGMWGNNVDWTEPGHAIDVADLLWANGEACEMIIVTPDAGGGDPNVYQNGYLDMDGWEYEKFFFNEFMPFVEKKWRIISDKQHRAVAGLSMGGGGATIYGLHHPDIFNAVYAMSALMEIPEGPNGGGNQNADPNSPMGKLVKSVMANSCTKFVKNADDATKEQLRTVAWFVDCGDDDFLLDRNIDFYQAMRNNHIPCQFRVRDGGHVWEYWRTALYQCLPFVTRNFGK